MNTPRTLLLAAVMVFSACGGSGTTATAPDPAAVRPTDNAMLRGHLEACRSGDAKRCYFAGVLLYNGFEGVPMDRRRGLELDRHACRVGSKHACFFLGVDAAGTTPGPLSAKSREYFARACKLGYESACRPCPTAPIRNCK